MIRGYYTAASGLVTNQQKLNNYANNIANSGTVGYKKDNLVAGTFGEHVAMRLNAYQESRKEEIGRGVFMQVVDYKYTDHTQGSFTQTDRTLDMAIQGQGYFIVSGDDGEAMLTRDGQFAIDDEGYLVLPGIGRVQGAEGDILIETSDFTMDTAGNIYVWDEDDEENELIDRLAIALVEDTAAMEKLPNGLYQVADYEEAEEDEIFIRHQTLEASNVDMSEEMTRIIASQRSLQSCSQIVKMYDELADQINSRISRI